MSENKQVYNSLSFGKYTSPWITALYKSGEKYLEQLKKNEKPDILKYSNNSYNNSWWSTDSEDECTHTLTCTCGCDGGI